MAECLIMKSGSTVNTADLTTTSPDVIEGDTFLGAGTDKKQTGNIKKQDKIQKKMDINESFTVLDGFFDDGSYAYQEVPMKQQITVEPASTGSFVETSNTYMEGNVIVKGVENLKPENIRMGAVVGDLSGTWKGYVNTSPLTPYWYGIFYPGQSGTTVRSVSVNEAIVNWYQTSQSSDHPYIYLTSQKQGMTPAIGFTNSIALDGVKSVTVGYALNDRSANEYTRVMLTQNYSDTLFDMGWQYVDVSLGYNEMFVLPSTAATDLGVFREVTFQISKPSQLHFVFFTIGVTSSSTFKPSLAVHYVKFNK